MCVKYKYVEMIEMKGKHLKRIWRFAVITAAMPIDNYCFRNNNWMWHFRLRCFTTQLSNEKMRYLCGCLFFGC